MCVRIASCSTVVLDHKREHMCASQEFTRPDLAARQFAYCCDSLLCLTASVCTSSPLISWSSSLCFGASCLLRVFGSLALTVCTVLESTAHAHRKHSWRVHISTIITHTHNQHTQLLQIYLRSTTSQRCSAGLGSGDCGGRTETSVSCSRNQFDLIHGM